MRKDEVLNSVHILTRTKKEDELIHELLSEIYELGLSLINSKLDKKVTEIPQELAFILKKYMMFQYQKLDDEGKTSSKLDVISSNYLTDDEYLEQFNANFDKYNNKKNLGNGSFLNYFM